MHQTHLHPDSVMDEDQKRQRKKQEEEEEEEGEGDWCHMGQLVDLTLQTDWLHKFYIK